VDLKVLSQFEEFHEFVAGTRAATDKPTPTPAGRGDE
jgi:hypothetical protein